MKTTTAQTTTTTPHGAESGRTMRKKTKHVAAAALATVGLLASAGLALGSTLDQIISGGVDQTIAPPAAPGDPETALGPDGQTLVAFTSTDAPWGTRLVQPGVNCATSDAGATQFCDLFATSGTISVAGANHTVWGYGTASAQASVPGPVMVATVGEQLAVCLHNELPVSTSLQISGLPAGAVAAGAPGSSCTGALYTITAPNPGTFVYEPSASEPTGNRQAALGLSGVLVVRPAATAVCVDPALRAGCAYGDLDNRDVFDDEAMMMVNDFDPALLATLDQTDGPLGAAAADAAMAFPIVDSVDSIHLVNGKAYPDTEVINTRAGASVLLRYANLGPIDRTTGVLGAQQNVLGRDGQPLVHEQDLTGVMVTPGQTADVIVDLPGTAYPDQRFAVVDQSKRLASSAGQAGVAGALTFLNVWAYPGDPGQPVPTKLTLADGLIAGTADAVDGSGDLTVRFTQGADTVSSRYFVDQLGTTAKPAALDTPSTGIGEAVVPAAALRALTNGPHVLWAQSTNAATDLVDGEVTAGSPTLTSATAVFTNADLGAYVTVADAGAAVPGTALFAKVKAVVNATTVTLSKPAQATLSGASFSIDRWGVATGVAFFVDRDGPAVHSTWAEPAVINDAAVASDAKLVNNVAVIHATGDASSTGRSTIEAGKYAVQQLSTEVPAPADDTVCQGLAASGIDLGFDPELLHSQVQAFAGPYTNAGLTDGHYEAVVSAKDAYHWSSTCARVPFDVDTNAPALGNSPAPYANGADPASTDGTVGYAGNPAWQASVYVQATITDVTVADVQSNVTRIEGFFDSDATKASGTGFQFVPADGAYDSPSERGYVLVPLSTIRTLTPGAHDIVVHGLDEAGNWGTLQTAATITFDGAPAPAPAIALQSVNVAGNTMTVAARAIGANIASVQAVVDGTPVAAGAPVTVGGMTVTVASAATLPASATDVTVSITGTVGARVPVVVLQATDTHAATVSVGVPGVQVNSISSAQVGNNANNRAATVAFAAGSGTGAAQVALVEAAVGAGSFTTVTMDQPLPNSVATGSVTTGSFPWSTAQTVTIRVTDLNGATVQITRTVPAITGSAATANVSATQQRTTVTFAASFGAGAPAVASVEWQMTAQTVGAAPTSGWVAPTTATTYVTPNYARNGAGSQQRVWYRITDASGVVSTGYRNIP